MARPRLALNPVDPFANDSLPDGFYDESRPRNASSRGLVSAFRVKGGSGQLYGFTVLSTKGSAQFVQVFDVVDLPANGAAPECVFDIAANDFLAVDWLPGRTFRVGCVIANSTTAATLTAGAADCFVDAQYL